MNNWCICWLFTHIFTGILIFKGLTARRLYKSFGVKGLRVEASTVLGIRFINASWRGFHTALALLSIF
jgi:hypothetical protein